ncbi:MAG: HEAT repeat domain-containing protein [Candidatus Nitrosotenuis sp.]
MALLIFDDDKIKGLPVAQRLERCREIIHSEKDESKRWDAVWLAGEIAENREKIDPIFNEVADLMAWVLENDDNSVVKHEACYQIAARNMRDKIPALINAALGDKSGLTKHEALESLGLMRATEATELIKEALNDPLDDVRQTAAFVIKRLKRMEAAGAYKPSDII